MKLGSKQCLLLAAAGCLLFANPASAFDFGNMMNPSKWMGGNKDRDRYNDYYNAPGYGYGGPPGYGYGGPPGYGYGAPPGYGYGGAPGYGYGGIPGASYGNAPGYSQPGSESREQEINRLQERLRQLEGEVR